MKKTQNKVTLIEIASAAGVGIATVDRVINRRGGVSPSKEAKVLECARRLELDRVLYRGYMKMLRIAVVMQSPDNPFFVDMRDAFSEVNNALLPVKLQCFIYYADPKNTQATVNLLDQLSSNHDAIVVVSPAEPAISDKLREISLKIPVVTMVTDLPDCGRIAYVGPNNRKIGRVAGELMGRFIGASGGKIYVILGMQRLLGHEEREMGFRTVLREYFLQCEIAGVFESDENQSKAGKVIYDALRNDSSIKGIYNVSAGNSAIVKTVQSLGLSDQLVLITHELTKARRSMLRQGVIDAVIDQNPRLEARRVVDVLARHFDRLESSNSRIDEFTPFQIYLRENC